MDDTNNTAGGAPQENNQAPNPADTTPQANAGTNQQGGTEQQEQNAATNQPASFTEEVDGKKESNDSRSGSFKAGQEDMARKKDVIIQQQAEQIAALKAASQQTQTQPQAQVSSQQAQPSVSDELKQDIENIKYLQQREMKVNTHLQANADDVPLRSAVMEMSSKPQYKELTTQDLFALARAQNPQSTNQEQPAAGQVTQGAVAGNQGNPQNLQDLKTRINASRQQLAQQTGRPADPV